MIRTPWLSRWTSPTSSLGAMPPMPPMAPIPPAILGRRAAAPAAPLLLLALLALLAGGCGSFDNQRVPEDFPSGARPAPVPAADLAAANADQAQLPPAPHAEPAVEAPAEQPPGKAVAVATRPGTEAAPSHPLQ